MTEKHVPALDLLRGLAALSVVIPHFFMAVGVGTHNAEAVSILGVEVFFVLSGFVLASQILLVTVEHPSLANLGIFWVRRWMRTIPAYLVALTLTSVGTHALTSADFLRYLFYVQNFATQANTRDYFTIAWSLSVEEWFYLLFPLFCLALVPVIPARRRAAMAALLFVLIITILRFTFGDSADWGAGTRRIVMFRMDAIAWGFVLHLVCTRTSLLKRMSLGVAAGLVTALSGAAAILTAIMPTEGRLIEGLFPFYVPLFGAAAILAALKLDAALARSPGMIRFASWMGRISYSTYLFHILVLSALLPFTGQLSIALTLPLFLVLVAGVASLIYTGLEAPILAGRPRFNVRPATPIASYSFRSTQV
ncbi:acyltransferase family protein [Bradyrhizobium sp. PMVTL-01]|uniref:acyltransferase family protein n=1 Tax=Bradyrhizobium sp. PMVTL-01 TaxID=3434999 RepID=UPI003F72AD2D